MKISFIGDSYCAEVGNEPFESYPFIVANYFNAEIICSGLAADTLFHSYQTFLEKVEESDYIIFCVSDFNRTPNRYRVPTVSGRIPSNMEELPLGASKKLRECWNKVYGDNDIFDELLISMDTYSKTMDSEFHKIAQKGILREIDLLIKKLNKKCIFFKSFDDSFGGYIPENIVWCDKSLRSIKLNGNIGISKKDLYDVKNFPKMNHLFESDNKKVSKLIIDIIKSDNFTPREIKMERYL